MFNKSQKHLRSVVFDFKCQNLSAQVMSPNCGIKSRTPDYDLQNLLFLSSMVLLLLLLLWLPMLFLLLILSWAAIATRRITLGMPVAKSTSHCCGS